MACNLHISYGSLLPRPPFSTILSLRLKSRWEQAHIPLNGPLVPQKLHIRSIDLDLSLRALLEVLIAAQGREAPILGDDDLLAAWELVLRTAKGFDGCCAVW